MSNTTTDWYDAEAPTEYQDRDLVHDICPCGDDGFIEGPAGYFRCEGCLTTWAGDPENAELVQFFEPEEGADGE